MTTNLYCIYDKVANLMVGGILRVGNDEVARRSFHASLSAKDSPLAGHEGDYCLYRIGSINENDLAITPLDIRPIIADGRDWLNANTIVPSTTPGNR